MHNLGCSQRILLVYYLALKLMDSFLFGLKIVLTFFKSLFHFQQWLVCLALQVQNLSLQVLVFTLQSIRL